MRLLRLCLASLLVTSGLAFAAAGGDPREGEETTIKKTTESYVTAFNKGDGAAVAAHRTKEGDYITVAGEVSATTAAVAQPPKMKMATEIPKSIIMPDKVKTRIGVLEFFDGFPTDDTVKKAYDFLDFQRGVDVFLDEMRAASMVAMRNGLRSEGITKSNQVALFEQLMDSKALWLTANTETVYASNFLDLKTDGPTVIESPPNVLGILDDMWMRYIGDMGNAGPDKGKGGKFLVLPPGFKGTVPDGYHVFRSKTYGV